MVVDNKLFIAGKWVDSWKSEHFPTINPATEETITEVPRGMEQDIHLAVEAAQSAMSGPWSAISPSERGRQILKLAHTIQAHRQELAELETLDVGKPLRDSLGDIDGVVETLEYNAGAADKLQGDTIPLGPEYVDFTWLEPLGVTAHIVPWNFPLGMAIRSIAPALAAGCTVVLKPAEQSPLSSLRMAALAQSAGIPDGVINVVTGYGDEAGAALVRHPGVAGITFTGSVETGRLIMAQAAQGIKPVILELGGKNPMIVFPDADLDRAVADAREGVFGNCGQVCSSVSRLLLHHSIKSEFLDRLAREASRLQIGPGMDNPDLGPLVSAEQYQRVLGYIRTGASEGAQIFMGGGRPAQFEKGYFIEPTILDAVKPEMRVAREEIFGPVVAALTFETEDQAVTLANAVSYGLVAGVYTQDISRALRLAKKIQAGSVWINGWYLGGVQAPVGGYKESGIGRERGLAGIHNYLQVKNIGIRL
jgi:aldehyde dehydrogenase (NAD+)